jgi:hypothetical protein
MEVSGQLHAPAALPPGKELRAVLNAVVKKKCAEENICT